MSDLTPERWREVSALLDRLLTVEPAEREAWLERQVADPELRAEVAALAANADRESGVLEDAAAARLGTLLREEGFVEEPAASPAGRRVGPFRIAHEVGRGGMGVVYLAERVDGQFEQRVALKLIKRGLDTDEILDRFRRERQILAQLEHPSIARLLDGGVSDDGQPYFAMEYVEGEPITGYCDGRQLGIADRLRLFDRVCDAVQYAHRNLIVHRDLKPSNILVTGEGELKLVDFGIAKLLSEEPTVPLVTRADAKPLTPAYAAPEQLRGEPVTTATDVYALGVVLYELLCGRRPHGAAGTSVPELERQVLETDPAPPSSRALDLPGSSAAAGDDPSAQEIAAARQATPAALARRMTGDLDAIVLTALRKEPARRYSSASVLRQDLARHLDHQPILARPDGALYRTGKFARRHRVAVAAALLVGLSLVAGLAGTLWQARQKGLEAAKARQVTDFVLGLFEGADPALARGEEITARELVEQGTERVERELAGQPAVQAEMDLVLGRINDRLGLSEAALELLDRGLERTTGAAGAAARATRANILRAKGAALVNLGRAAEAEPVLLKAQAEHRRLADVDDAEVAEDLDWLSIALHALGRLAEAETAARRSFELRLRALGPDHLKVAGSYNNLAVLQRERGDFDGAESNYRKALAIRRPALGTVHPETADTLNNLAALLYHRGRYADAEPAFREVTEIYGRLYGERHSRTVMGQNNWATVLMRLGEVERAEQLYESVLGYWRETASEGHPNALMTRSNLSLLYLLDGEPGRAEQMAVAVAESATEVLGAEHPVTAIFGLRLAAAERQLGRVASARERAGGSLVVLEEVYGADHQHVAAALEERGLAEFETGDTEAAVSNLRRALEIRRAAAGEEAFETLTVRTALAGVLHADRLLNEAERLLRANLTTARRVLPEGHPILIDILIALGRSLVADGRGTEAEPLLEEAVALAISRYGADNWRTGQAELRLAEHLAAEGRLAAAREQAGRARLALLGALGPGHRLVQEADRLIAVESVS